MTCKGGAIIKSITTLREHAGLTQTQLAEMLNVTQSTVSQWEIGDKNPRFEKIPQLAEALGCTINDLFKKEDSDG